MSQNKSIWHVTHTYTCNSFNEPEHDTTYKTTRALRILQTDLRSHAEGLSENRMLA